VYNNVILQEIGDIMAGRPTKYHSSYNTQVYKLCLLNAITPDIAKFYEVAESTINLWIKTYPAFSDAIKKGKQKADAEVAKALHHRATGYSHKEDKVFCTNGVVTVVPTIKCYPPDTAAAFIWLKNRAGWKDKQETEHTLSKETVTLMGLIDGKSKGKLPSKREDNE